MRYVLNLRRRNDGFTLVEMMVTLVCISLVMIAVMSWMLVGIRVEKSAADTMERQQNTRVILSLMESMTSSGKVSRVQHTGVAAIDEDEEASQSGSAGMDWALLDKSGNALVRYRAGSGTIVTGSGSVLMDGLEYADAEFDGVKKMLQLKLKADGQEYSSDIFCRTAVESLSYGTAELLELARRKTETISSRYAFLSLLTSQIGSSGEIIDSGEVNGSEGYYKYKYFTECYLANTAGNQGGIVNNWSLDGSGTGMNWSPKTPWCATYVSWALLHMNHNCFDNDDLTLAYVPLFANVNDGRELFDERYNLGDGFSETGGLNTGIIDPQTGLPMGSGHPGGGEPIYGKDHPTQKVGKWIDTLKAQENPEKIAPGDLIFFDWGEVGTESGVGQDQEGNGESGSGESGSGDGSLDHVGVVFYIDGNQIFTIEGNTDGKVLIRNYAITDPAIVGYGLLDWKKSS
ncbi:MAG: prepilin-type N-terminal cleavage/methylation domain-containing protein [Firmicutes bacterium]|nr:prepilin-type N-terminal cleavage/methylation domain-containing protein [Bacillota bacterium]